MTDIETLRKKLDGTTDIVVINELADGYNAYVYYAQKINGKYYYVEHLSTESGTEEDLSEDEFETFEDLVAYVEREETK